MQITDKLFLKIKKIFEIHWFIPIISAFVFLVVWIVFVAFDLPRVLPTASVSGGEVYGIIFRNQVWQGNIIISGDLITLPGVLVTILPGTNITVLKSGDKFNLDFSLQHTKDGVNTELVNHGVENGEPFLNEREKIHIRIHNIYVQGNIGKPVRINSADPMGSPYDINEIEFDNGEMNFLELSNYRKLEIGPNVIVKNSIFRISQIIWTC